MYFTVFYEALCLWVCEVNTHTELPIKTRDGVQCNRLTDAKFNLVYFCFEAVKSAAE